MVTAPRDLNPVEIRNHAHGHGTRPSVFVTRMDARGVLLCAKFCRFALHNKHSKQPPHSVVLGLGLSRLLLLLLVQSRGFYEDEGD